MCLFSREMFVCKQDHAKQRRALRCTLGLRVQPSMETLANV